MAVCAGAGGDTANFAELTNAAVSQNLSISQEILWHRVMKNHAPSIKTRKERFENYLSFLSNELDHADHIKPFRDYLVGLLLQGERKSIEPIAARIDPDHLRAKHPSLNHFIAVVTWSDRALLRTIRHYALPALLHLGEVESWVVDDTRFPTVGQHSVGVERQYYG